MRESYGQVLSTWLSFVAADPVLAVTIAAKMGWMILIPFQIEPFRVFVIPTQSDSQYLWHGDAPFQSLSITPTLWEIATAFDRGIFHPIPYALLSAAASLWMSAIFLVIFAWKSTRGTERADTAPIVAIGSAICFMLAMR
ncbi:MAG: hypothetical protein WCE79_10350 [Xanthobacteraceae bacterium]